MRRKSEMGVVFIEWIVLFLVVATAVILMGKYVSRAIQGRGWELSKSIGATPIDPVNGNFYEHTIIKMNSETVYNYDEINEEVTVISNSNTERKYSYAGNTPIT